MNKLFRYCSRVTDKPIFPAVVVFTLTFLISGALLEITSVADGGVNCNNKEQAEKNLCTKLNIIFLILAPTIPVMAGIGVYVYARNKQRHWAKNVFTNPPYSEGEKYD